MAIEHNNVDKAIFMFLQDTYGEIVMRPNFAWIREFLHRPQFWIQDSNIFIEVDGAEHFVDMIPEVKHLTMVKLDMIKTGLFISNGYAVVRVDTTFLKKNGEWRPKLRTAITMSDTVQGKVVYLADDNRYNKLKDLMAGVKR